MVYLRQTKILTDEVSSPINDTCICNGWNDEIIGVSTSLTNNIKQKEKGTVLKD